MAASSADAVVELQESVEDLTLALGLDLGLECHLNWIRIENFKPRDMESSFEFEERTRTEKEGLETDGDSASIETKFSQRLSEVVFAHLQNDNDSAVALVKTAGELLESEESKELLPERVQAYRYIIQANRAVLAFRMKDFDTLDEAKQKTLEYDISTPKAQALILSMKAEFAENTEDAVELWRQVYELDPNVAQYLNKYYIHLRRLGRLKDNFLNPPSELAIELAEKAFAIDPDTPEVLYTMTRLYFDILKQISFDATYIETCPVVRNIGVEELVRKLKLFARKGVAEKPKSPNRAIRLAEILNYRLRGIVSVDYEDEEADRREAREQYLYCLENWPDNPHVLHKVGKFMSRGRGTAEDRKNGIELVKLSMMSKQNEGLPALMEYIRLVSPAKSNDPAGLDELIELLDDQIPRFQRKPSQGARLECLKATVLFKKHEFGEAVDVWLKAQNMDPGLFKRDATAFNGKGTLKVFFTGADYWELRTYVMNMIENEPVGSGRLEGLEEILDAIAPKPRPFEARPYNRFQNSGQGESIGRLESGRAALASSTRNTTRSTEAMTMPSSSAGRRSNPPPSFGELNAESDSNWRSGPRK